MFHHIRGQWSVNFYVRGNFYLDVRLLIHSEPSIKTTVHLSMKQSLTPPESAHLLSKPHQSFWPPDKKLCRMLHITSINSILLEKAIATYNIVDLQVLPSPNRTRVNPIARVNNIVENYFTHFFRCGTMFIGFLELSQRCSCIKLNGVFVSHEPTKGWNQSECFIFKFVHLHVLPQMNVNNCIWTRNDINSNFFHDATNVSASANKIWHYCSKDLEEMGWEASRPATLAKDRSRADVSCERLCSIMCMSSVTTLCQFKCMAPTCTVPLNGGWVGHPFVTFFADPPSSPTTYWTRTCISPVFSLALMPERLRGQPPWKKTEAELMCLVYGFSV